MNKQNKHIYNILFILFLISTLCLVSLKAEDLNESEAMNSDQEAAFTLITSQTLTPLEKPSLESSLFFDVSSRKSSPKFSLKPAVLKAGATNYPKTYQYIQNYKKSHRFGKSLFEASLITNLALNAADYFTTQEALKYDGLEEGNPLMKPFVKNDLTFAAVKIGLTVSNYFIMKKLYKKNKALAWVVSIASNLVLSYVVSSNMTHIHEAKSW
ncbi:MAG: hypothetical protein GF421_03370 [Candidatus Aminicenantes bacterium]|nr:hypothetical protein [Candidatus Aminicenantes bacterium]